MCLQNSMFLKFVRDYFGWGKQVCSGGLVKISFECPFRFKIPKVFFLWRKPFPLTTTGKIRRDQVRKEVVSELHSLHSNIWNIPRRHCPLNYCMMLQHVLIPRPRPMLQTCSDNPCIRHYHFHTHDDKIEITYFKMVYQFPSHPITLCHFETVLSMMTNKKLTVLITWDILDQ